MYYEYWGLKKHAFHNVPDPSMYFDMHESVESAVSEVLFAIEEGDECLAVIVGEVGLGKTMSLRMILHHLDENKNEAVLITNPDLTFPQLLREIIGQLQGETCSVQSKDKLLETFHQILVTKNRENKKIVILTDEANAIRRTNLESMRLLTNLQADDHNLFTLVLAGQPQLAEELEQPEMANLFQRIGIYAKLSKLGSREILHDYIEHRLERAGGSRQVFTAEAFERIWRHSEAGTPRLVNRICKLSLKAGETHQMKVIDGKVIDAIAARFQRTGMKKHQNQSPEPPPMDEEKPQLRPADPVVERSQEERPSILFDEEPGVMSPDPPGLLPPVVQPEQEPATQTEVSAVQKTDEPKPESPVEPSVTQKNDEPEPATQTEASAVQKADEPKPESQVKPARPQKIDEPEPAAQTEASAVQKADEPKPKSPMEPAGQQKNDEPESEINQEDELMNLITEILKPDDARDMIGSQDLGQGIAPSPPEGLSWQGAKSASTRPLPPHRSMEAHSDPIAASSLPPVLDQSEEDARIEEEHNKEIILSMRERYRRPRQIGY